MIQITFKNLEKSKITRASVLEKISPLTDKFPDLGSGKMMIVLEMENSPTQAGPDLFKIKIHVTSGRYQGVTMEKSNINLYAAVAELVDHMLERLNRFGDKHRVKERKIARKIFQKTELSAEAIDTKSD